MVLLTAGLAAVIGVTAGTATSARNQSPLQAVGGHASAAVQQQAVTAGCRASTWNVDLGVASSYDMSPLIGCRTGPGIGSLSGTAHNLGGCSAAISGTLARPGSINMTWAGEGACTGEAVEFIGTMHFRQGTASGRWRDPAIGESGTWTAVRTS